MANDMPKRTQLEINKYIMLEYQIECADYRHGNGLYREMDYRTVVYI